MIGHSQNSAIRHAAPMLLFSSPISSTGIRFYVYIKQVKHSLKMIFKPKCFHFLFDCSRYSSCPVSTNSNKSAFPRPRRFGPTDQAPSPNNIHCNRPTYYIRPALKFQTENISYNTVMLTV